MSYSLEDIISWLCWFCSSFCSVGDVIIALCFHSPEAFSLVHGKITYYWKVKTCISKESVLVKSWYSTNNLCICQCFYSNCSTMLATPGSTDKPSNSAPTSHWWPIRAPRPLAWSLYDIAPGSWYQMPSQNMRKHAIVHRQPLAILNGSL